MIGTSYYRRSTTTVVVGTVALLLNNPANGSLGVFGFTNARRQLHSTTSTTSKLTLNAATIDAAEVLDSSSSISDSGGVAPEKFFVGECDETDEDCRLFQAIYRV